MSPFSLLRARSRWFSLSASALVLTLGSWAYGVGTRHFVLEAGKDFEGGELKGVALDSQGRLRPGLDLKPQAVSEAPAVWAALPDGGGLLLATGNEGKLLRVSGGQSSVVADTDALALTSLARAWGRVFAGATPGGKLYELKGDKLETFVTLEGAENVFALAFDEKEGVLYAATGPEGKLFRITAQGAATVHFDAEQSHLISVAASGGTVYAGTSGSALLYAISGPGRARVLRDFETTEVRAITVAKDGSVYAIANELRGGGGSDSVNAGRPAGPSSQDARKGKGTLYRFSPAGLPEELYASSEEHLISLSLDDKGRPVVGTGAEGRVVRVDGEGSSTILADLDERQVAYVGLTGDQGYVVGSDPVVVHRAEGLGGQDAVYTSKVLDAGLRAHFGRVEFDAEGKVEIQTRTGNTKEPDASWSDWSGAQTSAFRTASPDGRYFQFRVRLPKAGQGVLRRVEVPFVTDNLRAIVKQVKVDGGRKGSKGLEKSGGPITEKPSTTVKLSFDVNNPDEDELRFRVEYKPLTGTNWFDALRPGQVLTDDSFTWDTANLPEGKYRVRVTASDELANPPGRVTSHSQESPVVLVDNTPPTVTSLVVQGRKVSGRVQDGVGPVRRIEIQRVGAESWVPVEPKDGIFDQAVEDFEIDLGAVFEPGPLLLTVRAFDMAGNSDVRPLRLEK